MVAVSRRNIRLLAVPLLVVAALFAGSLTFNWLINRPVRVHIPPQRVVHPNAFDYYMPSRTDPKIDVRAFDWCEEIRWAISRQARAKPKPVPALLASPGAPAPVVPQAVELRAVPAQPGIAFFDEYQLASLAEKQAILRDHRAYLRRVKSAFRFRCIVPREPKQDLFFRHFYHASWLLILEGQTKELRGDWDAALYSYMDSLRVGSDLACGGDIGDANCSAYQQETAVGNVACCVDHISAACARACARRIAAIRRDQPCYADALLETKYAVQTEVLGCLAQPDWRQRFLAVFRDLGVKDRDRWDVLRVRTVSKSAIMAHYDYWLDLQIAEARKPFPLDRTPVGMGKYCFLEYFSSCYEPQGTESRKYFEYAHALDGLLEVALALRAWQLDKGSYPDSLQQLLPAYLDTLPADPFSVRGTFHYRRGKTGYLLYSLGPNGRDDAGRPIGQIWDYPPRGDIVWGVTNAEPSLPRSLTKQPPVRPLPHKIIGWKSRWDETTSRTATPIGAPPP